MAAKALLLAVACSLALCLPAPGQELARLAGAKPLTLEGDLSARMVAGISTFLDQQTESSVKGRPDFWHRDFSSTEAWDKSIQPNRERLRVIVGAVDTRVSTAGLEILSATTNSLIVGETDTLIVRAVRWPVLEGVYGEGLWILPKGPVVARVVALPDADQTPEMLAGLAPGLEPERQFARRLAEHGCEVLVPTLIDRQDTFSGNARLNRYTNQSHREWIYRQAYEMGRHVIGFEVQKILAGLDFFQKENAGAGPSAVKLGVAGYAEGGLLALYAAALDSRINAALVSGYFDSRERLWEEPIYRNIFGLLREFGDAEIATLIAPRTLVIEHSPVPSITGPPPVRQGRSGAAPGKLTTPDYSSVETEFERARSLLKQGPAGFCDNWTLICGTEGRSTGPFSDRALVAFVNALGIPAKNTKPPGRAPVDGRRGFDPDQRQRAQVAQLSDYTQKLLRISDQTRAAFFWSKIRQGSTQELHETTAPFRKMFREDIMGSFGPPALPSNPQARKILDQPKWTGYEVTLDVYPEVFAWGILLVPKDLSPNERRPVVVCQHGLEGVPADTLNEDTNSRAYGYYKAFAARLAERGFVVFAPHNPYRGGDAFRVLQRKANPLGKSLFSIIIAQHSRLLEWLAELPFVDSKRIAFYGLSYGGKTAMRVPASLEGYCLSICSGDFNDWVRKNASVEDAVSYMFMGEYEMPEWNLGQTFNYAEMAALIAPRPFMVERGHNDGVGLDEWVAYEYAKVRRLYDTSGIPDCTAIEFFNGPHTINGVGTFEFLQKQLNWGARAN